MRTVAKYRFCDKEEESIIRLSIEEMVTEEYMKPMFLGVKTDEIGDDVVFAFAETENEIFKEIDRRYSSLDTFEYLEEVEIADE